MDIFDIPIVEITAQYMEYIRAMKEANLDVMSEFLVMAATLPFTYKKSNCRRTFLKEGNHERLDKTVDIENNVQSLAKWRGPPPV